MAGKTARWESELWRYMSLGDGVHCPIYESCQTRLHNSSWCLSDHEDYHKAWNKFVDEDAPDLSNPASAEFKFFSCPEGGRIFELVTRLAIKYQREAGIDRPPVPADLITRAYDNFPIEVRQIPLRVYHGAVWRLSDCWLVHLNSSDSPARQRFTLYHEIFHILAHCRATPVFRNASHGRDGYFNELLADHFAGNLLLPYDLVVAKWAEIRDVNQMADIFNVPESVMYLCLKAMHLI